MQSAEVQRVAARHSNRRGTRHAVSHCEAKLRILGTGLDELVRVRLDAGGYPHEQRRAHVRAGDQRLDPVELVMGVGDDASDTRVERGTQLVVRLVVAMEDDPRRRKAGVERHEQLAAGRDVEVKLFLVDEPHHRLAQKRLARVRDAAGAEVRDILAAPGAQLVFVVDEQRRAVLVGQRVQIGIQQGRRHERRVERLGRDRALPQRLCTSTR